MHIDDLQIPWNWNVQRLLTDRLTEQWKSIWVLCSCGVTCLSYPVSWHQSFAGFQLFLSAWGDNQLQRAVRLNRKAAASRGLSLDIMLPLRNWTGLKMTQLGTGHTKHLLPSIHITEKEMTCTMPKADSQALNWNKVKSMDSSRSGIVKLRVWILVTGCGPGGCPRFSRKGRDVEVLDQTVVSCIDDTIYLFFLTCCDYIITSLTPKKWWHFSDHSSLVTFHPGLLPPSGMFWKMPSYAAKKDKSAYSSPFLTLALRAKYTWDAFDSNKVRKQRRGRQLA